MHSLPLVLQVHASRKLAPIFGKPSPGFLVRRTGGFLRL